MAAEFRGWPEFVSGTGYNVGLRSPEEVVIVRFIDDEEAHVLISSSKVGPLFDRVVGRTAHALTAHSDYLMLYRLPEGPNPPAPISIAGTPPADAGDRASGAHGSC